MTSLIRRAASEAMAFAQASRMDALRRSNPITAYKRLRDEAIQAAASPLAFDQLLTICLEAVSEHGDAHSKRPPLWFICDAPDPLEQLAVRQEVFSLPPEDVIDLDVAYAAAAEERRGGLRVGRDPHDLAGYLMEAAELARHLWDHPALPVDAAIRGAMLATVPTLHVRASVLLNRPGLHPRARRTPATAFGHSTAQGQS